MNLFHIIQLVINNKKIIQTQKQQRKVKNKISKINKIQEFKNWQIKLLLTRSVIINLNF